MSARTSCEYDAATVEPSTSDRENAQSRALARVHIVGTDREAAFDDIVALAADVCGTPFAGVTLTDGELEWTKASVGIGEPEIQPYGLFTHFTLSSSAPFVVADATSDPRFSDSQWVPGGSRIRCYAGVTLRAPDQAAVGCLWVGDRAPGVLSDQRMAMLSALGRQVERLFELRRRVHAGAVAHEELSRNRLQLQHILDAITQGVVVHGADGSIVQANPAAQRVLGLTLEQMRGRTPIDPRWATIHRDGSPFLGDAHPASVTLRDGVAVRDVTFGVARPDGERRWLLVNSVPLAITDVGDPAGAQSLGAVATFSDITEITELNDQLHQSLSELADAAQERAALLSAVSHDIRAPLASIRMMTEILEDRADAITVAQRSELVHRVRVEARRTEGVLADLVSANRVGAGLNAPHRQQVDLDQLVRSAAREFANDDHEVCVGELHGDLMIWADRAQMERILDNLISNAVRHTPRGSRVIVDAIERDGEIEISVSDNGPGVPEDMRLRIFDAYVRGDRSGDRPGTGLGLFLVQQFAQFHGGRAWYQAAPGGGARVLVSLPHIVAPRDDLSAVRRPQ